jgi:hypothetical protein
MAKLSAIKRDFVKYGRFDTIEHARNGLKGKDKDRLAEARLALHKVHEKAKKLLRKG